MPIRMFIVLSQKTLEYHCNNIYGMHIYLQDCYFSIIEIPLLLAQVLIFLYVNWENCELNTSK